MSLLRLHTTTSSSCLRFCTTVEGEFIVLHVCALRGPNTFALVIVPPPAIFEEFAEIRGWKALAGQRGCARPAGPGESTTTGSLPALLNAELTVKQGSSLEGKGEVSVIRGGDDAKNDDDVGVEGRGGSSNTLALRACFGGEILIFDAWMSRSVAEDAGGTKVGWICVKFRREPRLPSEGSCWTYSVSSEGSGRRERRRLFSRWRSTRSCPCCGRRRCRACGET